MPFGGTSFWRQHLRLPKPGSWPHFQPFWTTFWTSSSEILGCSFYPKIKIILNGKLVNHGKPIPIHVFSCLRLLQLGWRLHRHPRPQQRAVGHVAHGPVRAALVRTLLGLGEGRSPEARGLVTSVDWGPGKALGKKVEEKMIAKEKLSH